MGNCFGSRVKSLSPTATRPSSPGPSSKTGSSTTTTGKLSSFSISTFGQSTGSSISVREASPEGRILEAPNLRTFTFAELRSATRNFKPETVLGEGGFGRVYKGWVDEKTLVPAKSGMGMVVAVKKLNPESMQGFEEWQLFHDFVAYIRSFLMARSRKLL